MAQSRREVGWWVAVVVVGVALAFTPFLTSLIRGTLAELLTNPIGLVLYVGPGVGVIYGGDRLRRANFGSQLSRLVFQYMVVGITVLIAIVALLSLSQLLEMGRVDIDPSTCELAANIGAVSGLLVGYNQARAVTNAREAAREKARKTVAEEERETLQFLNETLRHHVLNGMQLIRGNASLLADEAAPNSAATRRAETIIDRSDAVTGLIRNVRALGVAVEHPPEQSSIDLTEIVESELDAARELFPHVAFDSSLPDATLVRAGPLLRITIENLLRNAAHHAGDTPTVHVSIQTENGTVKLVVEDDGPGIPEEIRAQLFERTEAAADGLGLYLVERITSRYGGTATVEESSLGGVAVIVSLPRFSPSADESGAATAES